MAAAVALAKLFSPSEVDWALGHAAVHARFAEADLASVLDHHAGRVASGVTHRPERTTASPMAPRGGPPSDRASCTVPKLGQVVMAVDALRRVEVDMLLVIVLGGLVALLKQRLVHHNATP